MKKETIVLLECVSELLESGSVDAATRILNRAIDNAKADSEKRREGARIRQQRKRKKDSRHAVSHHVTRDTPSPSSPPPVPPFNPPLTPTPSSTPPEAPMSMHVMEQGSVDRSTKNGKPLNEWQARVQNLQAVLENLCGKQLDTRKHVIPILRSYSNDVEGIIGLCEGIDVSWADHPLAAIRKELKKRFDRKAMANAKMFDPELVKEIKDRRELCESGCTKGRWCPSHQSEYRDVLTESRAKELADKYFSNEERIESERQRYETKG